jgi:hypothetical protein
VLLASLRSGGRSRAQDVRRGVASPTALDIRDFTNGRGSDVDGPIRHAKPDRRTHTHEVPHTRAVRHRPDIHQPPLAGYEFETPIPQITPEGAKPFPPTGYRTLNARTWFFYGITVITPAMAMRLPGIGSQYLVSMLDADKNYLDGAKTYKVSLPKGIPAVNFWSFTLYDNMTRSMLDTPQRYPRAGSQSYPSPAAEPNADGSTTVYFGPTQPKDVGRGNWIQTAPGKGFFAILRLYGPLEPFFTKAWRPSEIELVR